MLLDPTATTQLVADFASATTDLVANADTASLELEQEGFISLEGLGKDLLIFLSASVFVAPVAQALKLPPVLLYLALGCAIGPFGLNLFSDTTVDSELGEFGILFLLFVEGLNLSPERIKALGSFFSLGATQMLVSIGAIFFVLFYGGPCVQLLARCLSQRSFVASFVRVADAPLLIAGRRLSAHRTAHPDEQRDDL
jgi:hypothetical protein